jgi:hypothetical protein
MADTSLHGCIHGVSRQPIPDSAPTSKRILVHTIAWEKVPAISAASANDLSAPTYQNVHYRVLNDRYVKQ